MAERSLIRDFTQGSVFKLLLVFSLPLMGSNLLQTVYNLVDMVVIGKFVGSTGLSAVTIGGDVLHLLTFVIMGLSNAGQVILSQYIGAGQREKVSPTIGTLFTVILSCSIVLSVGCLLGVDGILAAMNTPAQAWDYTRSYCITCIAGLIFICGYNLVSAILRGMGDSIHPLLFIVVATVVNLVLDLVFVAGLGLGPFGAALATVMGQGISFLCALVFLYRRRAAFGFDFKLRSFRPDRTVLPGFIRLGIPMCLQFAAIQFSMLYVNSFLNAYGIVASAVTGVGGKLGSVTAVVTNALSTAGSSVIGQNLGAERYERIHRVVGLSLAIGLAFASLLVFVTVCFPRTVFGLFNSEEAVLDMAMTYVPVAVIVYIGFAMRAPFNALINGSGNARLNLAVGLLDGIICRIGLALLLGITAGLGIRGFWYGNALAGFVPFFIGGVYYLSRRWMRPVAAAKEKAAP